MLRRCCVKDEVRTRQQELMLSGDGKKRVSFLFHLPFFLSANLRELTKLTMPTQLAVFPQSYLPNQPRIFYQKLYLGCNVKCSFLQKKTRQRRRLFNHRMSCQVKCYSSCMGDYASKDEKRILLKSFVVRFSLVYCNGRTSSITERDDEL